MTFDLFAPPPPPTGPESSIPDHAANRYRAYVAWKLTEEGRLAWETIEKHAVRLFEEGHERISVNALAEAVRRQYHVAINNTYRAWLADDLIARHPELEDRIERRRRRKAKV